MTRGAAVQDKVRTGTRQVLMMIMAAKLGWTEPGAEQEQGRNRSQRTALLFSPKLAPKPNLIKIG